MAELKQKYDCLQKRIEENLLIEVKMNQKYVVIDNIVNSMIEKFRKLDERVFNLEDQQPEHNNAFSIPPVENTCEQCEYISSCSAEFVENMKLQMKIKIILISK